MDYTGQVYLLDRVMEIQESAKVRMFKKILMWLTVIAVQLLLVVAVVAVVKGSSAEAEQTDVTVLAGSTARLTCPMTSRTVVWHREGQGFPFAFGSLVVSPDPRLSVSIDEIDGSELQIKNASELDSGNFFCYDVFTNGSFGKTISLRVVEERQAESFLSLTGEESVRPGQPIRLTCTATLLTNNSGPFPRLDWFKDGRRLAPGRRNMGLRITSFYDREADRRVSRVDISNSSSKHSGTYTCRSAIDLRIATLTVAVLTDTKSNTCSFGQFSCTASEKCIPHAWVCDGENDCSDWQDEAGCAARNSIGMDGVSSTVVTDSTDNTERTSASTMSTSTLIPIIPIGGVSCGPQGFRCSYDRQCIPITGVCDGYDDCPRGDDEQDCLARTCMPNRYQCKSSGVCIYTSRVCDGYNDCQGGDDEDGCKVSCEPGKSLCNSTYTRCIDDSRLCDGHTDCPDGEDEAGCPVVCPEDGMFICDKKCISQNRVCDRYADCRDHEDERNCSATDCSLGQYQCTSTKTCMIQDLVCDGKPDCRDGEDEVDCEGCAPTHYLCASSKTCVDRSTVCDGEPDCQGGEDETDCNILTMPPFLIPWRFCGRSYRIVCPTTNTCLSETMVCDGTVDCPGGLDEQDC